MKQRRKLAVFGLLFVCMVLVLSPVTAYAEGDTPGLSDVIKGQQQTTGQPATTQETPTNTAPTQNTQPVQQQQPVQQPTQQPKELKRTPKAV